MVPFPHQLLTLSNIKMSSALIGAKWHLFILMYISLYTNDIEPIAMFIGYWYFLPVTCLFKHFDHFSAGLSYWFVEALHMWGMCAHCTVILLDMHHLPYNGLSVKFIIFLLYHFWSRSIFLTLLFPKFPCKHAELSL